MASSSTDEEIRQIIKYQNYGAVVIDTDRQRYYDIEFIKQAKAILNQYFVNDHPSEEDAKALAEAVADLDVSGEKIQTYSPFHFHRLDGNIGRNFTQALQEFQRREGLEFQDGKFTRETFVALGVEGQNNGVGNFNEALGFTPLDYTLWPYPPTLQSVESFIRAVEKENGWQVGAMEAGLDREYVTWRDKIHEPDVGNNYGSSARGIVQILSGTRTNSNVDVFGDWDNVYVQILAKARVNVEHIEYANRMLSDDQELSLARREDLPHIRAVYRFGPGGYKAMADNPSARITSVVAQARASAVGTNNFNDLIEEYDKYFEDVIDPLEHYYNAPEALQVYDARNFCLHTKMIGSAEREKQLEGMYVVKGLIEQIRQEAGIDPNDVCVPAPDVEIVRPDVPDKPAPKRTI